MNFNFKYFRKHLFVLLFFISCHSFAQTISPTNGLQAGNGAVPCSDCVPIGWNDNGGTPDISNRTIAATTGTSGGGANWTSNATSNNDLTLPLPPNSHTTWLSLRDLGPPPAVEESVNTTIGGLTVGRTYEVVVYSLTAVTRNNGNGGKYAGAYNAQFSASVAGQTLTAGNLTQNTWGTSRLRFTATQTSHVLIVRPGADAAAGGGNSYETVQVSVTVNAINAVPIAVADNVTTNQNTPVSISVFTNDSDPDGSVVANTVRFANDQTSVVVPNQGTWSVDTTTGVVIFTPLPAFIGTATIPYTIKDNFVLDGVGNPSTSQPANISVTVVSAFGCTNALYLAQFSTLYSVNTSSNPFTYPPVGNASGDYNAIGIHPLNGRMYAMPSTSSNNLWIINTDGSSVNLGPVTGLPAGAYNAGEIDNLGNYYLKAGGLNNTLYRINVTTLVATPITLSASISVADLAFRTTNGLLYTVSNDTGQLLSINPTTGAVAGIGASPGTVAFGALFGSSTGEIYGSDNAGGFYQFNLTTGQRVLISNSPASGSNDGAHCVTSPIAFSADLAITKTDNTTTYAPGSTRVYTIVARNNGPFGVLGATVSDPLPTGILAANVSYTAVAAGGATTSVSGTQTGAINDVVNLPVNATVTYTVTVNVPFTFTGDLVNTVTITAPANSTDSNLANNTATDTDTQAVCYRPGITSGTVLDANHGFTSLARAGSTAPGNWPMVRKGAWTVLESRTKGFVVNRLTALQISQIPAANLVEGMMVYNITSDCLQVNTTGTPAGWTCFTTPTCPSN